VNTIWADTDTMTNIDSLIEQLGKLTVVEAGELSKRLEKAWGLDLSVLTSAPAQVSVVEEVKTTATVILTGYEPADKKISVLKKVREYFDGMGLLEAKNFIEDLPKTVKDCILSNDLKKTFTEFVKKKEIPNLLLSGTSGVGKTTVAKALCEELNCDYILINGSDEGRHIDTLRNEVKNFASTVSLTKESKHKVIIVDEADYMNADSVQPALRNFIETFFENCRFIFTCNFKNKILPALHSRCTVIDFRIANGEKEKTAKAFLERLKSILDEEHLSYEDKVLAELIIKYYPDFRRTINELQRYSVRGKIDSGILVSLSEINSGQLVKCIKEKRFSDMRSWVVQNLDTDPASLFRNVYDVLYNHLDKPSIPEAVLIIAKYQYQAAFVADHEINMVACLTEIMARCNFK